MGGLGVWMLIKLCRNTVVRSSLGLRNRENEDSLWYKDLIRLDYSTQCEISGRSGNSGGYWHALVQEPHKIRSEHRTFNLG